MTESRLHRLRYQWFEKMSTTNVFEKIGVVRICPDQMELSRFEVKFQTLGSDDESVAEELTVLVSGTKSPRNGLRGD